MYEILPSDAFNAFRLPRACRESAFCSVRNRDPAYTSKGIYEDGKSLALGAQFRGFPSNARVRPNRYLHCVPDSKQSIRSIEAACSDTRFAPFATH
jgi:hypothetical protein